MNKFAHAYLKTAGLGNLIRKAYRQGGLMDTGSTAQKMLVSDLPQVATGVAAGMGSYSAMDENNPNRLAYALAAGAGAGSIASPKSFRRYGRLRWMDDSAAGKRFMQAYEGMPANYVPSSNRAFLKELGIDALLKVAPTATVAGGAGAVAASEALNSGRRAANAYAGEVEGFAGQGKYQAHNPTTRQVWNLSGANAKKVYEYLGKSTQGLKFPKVFGQAPLTDSEIRAFTDIKKAPGSGAVLNDAVTNLNKSMEGLKEMTAKDPSGKDPDPLGLQPGLAPISKSVDTAAESSKAIARQLGATGQWIDAKTTGVGKWLSDNKTPIGYGAAGVAALGGGLVLAKLIESIGNLRKEYITVEKKKKKKNDDETAESAYVAIPG